MKIETERNERVSGKTEDLIKRWILCQIELDRIKSSINRAECELSNSKNELGKWLVPEKPLVGEIFCIWYGDSLISVTVKDVNTFDVTVRQRGKSLSV